MDTSISSAAPMQIRMVVRSRPACRDLALESDHAAEDDASSS